MLYKYLSSPDRYALLKDFARKNRKNMTLAEKLMWEHIRGKQLGYSFLRQVPIYDYIVDFICREKGLVIEVDGAYHLERDQIADDMVRQHDLEHMGFRVIRFTNEEVIFNIDNTLEQIKKQLTEQ